MTRVMMLMAAGVAAVVSTEAAVGAGVRADDSEYSCEHCRRERAEMMGIGAEEPKSRGAAFDEATGRDKLNYPPHRFADLRSMKLRLAIRDMQTPVLVGNMRLEFVPVGRALSELTLRVGPPESMAIGEIVLVRPGNDPGRTIAEPEKVNFTRERGSIVVRFDPPIAPVAPDATGQGAWITIPYVLTDPPEGLHWTRETPEWPGRAAQVHSQGQAESNHYWFPCHDFPNERLETEIVATVPAGFLVSSNGGLVAHEKGGWPEWAKSSGFPSPNGGSLEVKPWESAEVPDTGAPKAWDAAPGTSYETWHWKLDKSQVSYLVSMVVGKFDVVDVGGRVPAVGNEAPARKLELPVYVPAGKGSLAKQTYARTLEMIKLFEEKTSEPYPWGERYAQLCVHNFGAGGMENSGATTMYDLAFFDKVALADGDLDGLISHELGHQWFGDLITCNSWEHIWLNEGWATYMTDLWFEHRDGREAYDAAQWNHLKAISNDKADAPYQPAMASKVYDNPWEVFRRAANPYPKGAAVLGMLRARLGDEVFFKGVATYVDRFKDKTARTADFRRAMEDESATTLQRFFDQWVMRPGVPKVKIETSYSEGERALTIKLTQTQTIDGWNPAFELDVPMVVGLADGGEARPQIRFDSREASITMGGVGPVKFVNVDPGLTQLVNYDVAQGAAAWGEILRGRGPMGGRLRAAEALGKVAPDSSEAGDAAAALVSVLRDRDVDYRLRTDVAEALGKLGRAEELLVELERGVSDPKVRRSVVAGIAAAKKPEARAKGGSPEAADVLAAVVGKDESYAVRAAALRGLGTFKATRHMPVVLGALKTESQNDNVRQAALDALADLDQPEALDAAIAYTKFGVYSRTRPEAIRAVTKLAKHDANKAYDVIVALLADSEDRAVRSAGDALVNLKDPRGVSALEEFTQTQRAKGYEGMASAGERWVKSLREKLTAPAPAPATGG